MPRCETTEAGPIGPGAGVGLRFEPLDVEPQAQTPAAAHAYRHAQHLAGRLCSRRRVHA